MSGNQSNKQISSGRKSNKEQKLQEKYIDYMVGDFDLAKEINNGSIILPQNPQNMAKFSKKWQ